MKRHMLQWSIPVLAVSILILSAPHAVQARGQSERQSSMQQERQRSQGTQEMQKISGTVKRMKSVGVRGTDMENLVVQLDTKEGRRVVDLGNAEDLEDIDIQKGDRITAWGHTVDIGDRPVFMAHKLRANEQTVQIDRESQFERASQREFQPTSQRKKSYRQMQEEESDY